VKTARCFRLRQQYFLASASLQDVVDVVMVRKGDFQ